MRGHTGRTEGKPSPNWALFGRFTIYDESGLRTPEHVYLRRWRILQTPLFGVLLHNIRLADGDNPHDHPWPFVSITLRGAYREVVHYTLGWPKQLGRGAQRDHISLSLSAIQVLRSRRAHRIISVLPHTWTLVITGRRKRSWGFYTPAGYVEWWDYAAYREQLRHQAEATS